VVGRASKLAGSKAAPPFMSARWMGVAAGLELD
jgi:hypothetical protein